MGFFEPTLLSGRDWANRVKVRRDKGLRDFGLEREFILNIQLHDNKV